MSGEKRDADRVDLAGTLSAVVMVYQPAVIRQLSRGGMQVETTFPLQLDSLHEFRLTLGEQSIVVKGRIVHSRISDVDQDVVLYESGVEFVDAPERVSAAVAEFVDALQRGRRDARQ